MKRRTSFSGFLLIRNVLSKLLTCTQSYCQTPDCKMVGSSLAPKWLILAPFCWMNHQKSISISLISYTLLLEAVEASQCYFFENWLMKLKCPILLKPLDTIIQENYHVFYHSEPFRITRFKMRHPVQWMNNYSVWNSTAQMANFLKLKVT